MGLFTILGIVLVILKLMHQIELSWWFVLLPFFLDAIIAIIIFAFGISLFGSHMRDMKRMEKKHRERFGDW